MTKRSERSERLRVVNLVHHHPRGGWGKIWGPDVSRCLLRRGDTIVREVETDTKLSIRQHPRHTTPKDTKNCTHPVRAPFSPVDRNSPIRSSKIIVRTRLIVKLISNTSNFIRSDKLWSSNISTSCEKSLVEKKYKRTFLRFTYLAALLLKIAIVYVAAVISGRVAENQLEIGARRGERDLRITFPATILKAHLAFLDWSVPIAGVSHLCKFRERKEKKKGYFTIFEFEAGKIWSGIGRVMIDFHRDRSVGRDRNRRSELIFASGTRDAWNSRKRWYSIAFERANLRSELINIPFLESNFRLISVWARRKKENISKKNDIYKQSDTYKRLSNVYLNEVI